MTHEKDVVRQTGMERGETGGCSEHVLTHSPSVALHQSGRLQGAPGTNWLPLPRESPSAGTTCEVSDELLLKNLIPSCEIFIDTPTFALKNKETQY